MRSMPMQFCPADWKTPRISILAMAGRSVAQSRTMAGSLPPNSKTVGVRALAAERATCWATGREPMNRREERPGCDVRWGATEGQQVMGWMRWGEWLQAWRARRAMELK